MKALKGYSKTLQSLVVDSLKKIMSLLFLLLLLVPLGNSTPLEPGQKGGPWTEEELDIVREKVHASPFILQYATF